MKQRLIATLVGLAVLLSGGVRVQALIKNYELDIPIGSASVHSSGNGLLIEVQVLGNPGPFQLDDGQQFSFDFFDIWTNEGTVNQGEDTVPSVITATVDFVDPNTSQVITGVTIGGRLWSGLLQWGEVSWDGPVIVDIPGDRKFQIELSDEKFNLGVFGLAQGECHGATVSATVTQISAVPDGGHSLLLLGAGFILVGSLQRRWSK